jgi:hypothetical protein
MHEIAVSKIKKGGSPNSSFLFGFPQVSLITISVMISQGLFYLALSLQLAVAQKASTSIDLQHFGNYADLRGCSKNCLADFCCNYNLAGQLGCTTNECFCGHQSDGNVLLEQCINSECSGNSGDVASATSFYGAYCANYLASATTTVNTIQTGGGTAAGRQVLSTVTPTGNFLVEQS